MIDHGPVRLVWLILQAVNVLAIVQQNCTVRQYSKNYICGKPGSLQQPSPVGPSFPVENFETCRDFAITSYYQRTREHYHLSFDASNSRCQIFDEHIGQQGFVKDKKSTVRFYDTNCFLHCRHPCPPPLNTNLLFNDGFEIPNGLHPPWQPFYTKALVTPGFDSAHSYNVTYESLSQTVIGCTKQLYKVSMYYKTDGSHDMQYTLSRPESGFFLLNDTGGQWRLFEDLSYASGPDTYGPGQLEFQLNANSDPTDGPPLMVDNVRLEAIDGAAAIVPKPGSQSLFVNGGFESGDTAPWAVFGRTGRPSSAELISPGLSPTTGSPESSYALRFKGNGKVAVRFTVEQKIPTVPGKQYIFSFDYVVELLGQDLRGSSDGVVRLEGYNNNVYSSDREIDFEKQPRHNGRFRYVLPLIAHDTHTNVGLEFLSIDGTTMIVDNFEFVEAA